MRISVGIEGYSDEGVAGAILHACGLSVASFHGRNGKPHLLRRLPGYNEAAKYSPWLVVIDLDRADCAVTERLRYLPNPSRLMCFRIAVREAEAWLLADHAEMARFLGVSQDLMPGRPEELDDPKAALLALARRSRRRDVREGLVPRSGSGAQVGPTYASDIREFAMTRWRPLEAAKSAPSLARCVENLKALRKALSG